MDIFYGILMNYVIINQLLRGYSNAKADASKRFYCLKDRP